MEKTNSHEIFNKFPGNAPLNQTHLSALIAAIEKKNLLEAKPILVNSKFEVIDGQHRLEAAKRLGLPIYYIKIENLSVADMGTLNSNQRNWRMEHYMVLNADHVKNENYIKFREWLNKFSFNFGQGIAFFLNEFGVNEFRKKFKDGEFVFDENKNNLAELYQVFLNKIVSKTVGKTRLWTQQGCVRAFVAFLGNSEVHVSRLWEQMDKYPFLLNPRPSKEGMLEMLYEVYNYRRHIKVEQ